MSVVEAVYWIYEFRTICASELSKTDDRQTDKSGHPSKPSGLTSNHKHRPEELVKFPFTLIIPPCPRPNPKAKLTILFGQNYLTENSIGYLGKEEYSNVQWPILILIDLRDSPSDYP